MSGLSQIRKHQSFLRQIVGAESPSARRRIIQRATSDQLRAIAGLIYNILKGQVRLDRKGQQLVSKHRERFRRFINTNCSPTLHRPGCIHVKPAGIRRIRGELSQQRGGFLPFLLPLLGLVGKAALAGAVTGATGLAVKKIAGQ